MAGLGLQRLDKLSILMKEQRLKYLAQSGGGGLGGGGGDQGCMTALYEHMVRELIQRRVEDCHIVCVPQKQSSRPKDKSIKESRVIRIMAGRDAHSSE